MKAWRPVVFSGVSAVLLVLARQALTNVEADAIVEQVGDQPTSSSCWGVSLPQRRICRGDGLAGNNPERLVVGVPA